ncbi:MAG: hypothetical protein KAH48_03800, partial [Chlorobi bacterium]|nr:hypothetical protein [Chlorobiota bacterium]
MKSFTSLLLLIMFFGTAALNADPEITASEIEAHIKYLASDELAGRKPGTPGGLAAAEYIRGQFQKLGMTPLEDDFFHHFKLISNVEPGDNNKFQLGVEPFELNKDFIPMSFSASSLAEGEVVFAGYGLDMSNDSLRWNDYADIDVSGKWVMILRGDPDNNAPVSRFSDFSQDRLKIIESQDRKAAGILLVSPPAFDEKDKLIPMFYDKVSGGSLIPVINITRALADKILANGNTTIKLL